MLNCVELPPPETEPASPWAWAADLVIDWPDLVIDWPPVAIGWAVDLPGVEWPADDSYTVNNSELTVKTRPRGHRGQPLRTD